MGRYFPLKVEMETDPVHLVNPWSTALNEGGPSVEEWLGTLCLSPSLSSFLSHKISLNISLVLQSMFVLIPVYSCLIELSLKVNASSLLYPHEDNI